MDLVGIVITILASFVSFAIAFFLGIKYRKNIAERGIGIAEAQAENIKKEAENIKKEAESYKTLTIKAAEARKKEILLEAKEEGIKNKNEIEKEAQSRHKDNQKFEKRLIQKEESLDKKSDAIEKKEKYVSEKMEKEVQKYEKKNKEIEVVLDSHIKELERISGLTKEEARDFLLKTIEAEVKLDAAIMVKEIESKAKIDANKKAREILAIAVQRCSVDHIAETSVSVVQLPNDEMKGRIIGREGRNIRTLESLTGIDFIIDDTPEAVILSGFDPLRREIARLSLEKLVIDGRIHPSRIEEMVEKSKKEIEDTMREDGEAASFETGVHRLNPEIIKLLGKMKYRTSYGQNVLKHSIEVAHLCGLLAAELGADIALAKRAGLLHDIGKVIEHDKEGSHVVLGTALLKKYKESDIVVNACEAHHGDVEATNIISIITIAADSISAARPGARRETLENYIKRLHKLEEIADSFDGVEKSFAIQAGRELRLIVIPEIIEDKSMTMLAREVAKRIEAEVEYPGNIKINLIRETRAIEYAK